MCRNVDFHLGEDITFVTTSLSPLKMKQDSTRNTAYTVDCEDYVHVVKFNPFDTGDACSLIAYGGNNYVVVGTCRFQVSLHYC